MEERYKQMHELDERSKKILWAIIKSYTVYNGPIGSRTVMKRYPMGLSSATIRNTMADLEELGYVTQPHTSAGRIPTERGYRFYVDTIIKEHDYSINKKVLQQLADRLRIIEKDVNKLVNEASKTLSKFSHYLGIASAPKTELITLEHIKFIRHRKDNILCVLVSEEGIVKNKVITFKERAFSQGELDKIANYLNSELKGLTLKEIKTEILSRISREKTVCDKLISNALILCSKIMDWETENIFYYAGIAGTPNLPDFATLKQIKKLFKAIEEKHLMVKLLDKLSESEGVQVFIGSENILSEMKELSFVVSTYNDRRRTLGTIGVIGPTRMNYGKVIPIVSHTAKTLTQILSKR